MNDIFRNQFFMTFLISAIWIIPGIVFTAATNRKFKLRKKEIQAKKIAKLYSQFD